MSFRQLPYTLTQMRLLLFNLLLIFLICISNFCNLKSHHPSPSNIFYETFTCLSYAYDHSLINEFNCQILTGISLILVLMFHFLNLFLRSINCVLFPHGFTTSRQKSVLFEPSPMELLLVYLLTTDFSFDILYIINPNDILSLSSYHFHPMRISKPIELILTV